MNKLLVILSFLLLLSCESRQSYIAILPYKIDRSMATEVNNNIESMYGSPKGVMELKVYEDGVLLLDEEKEKSQLIYMTKIKNDTIIIIGLSGLTNALGFYLDLYKDKDAYKLSFMMHADSEIYKYTEDGDLQSTISVPCPYTSCILISKPTFKKDETVLGVVELRSNDFWQISNGKEHKYRVELKAYFLAREPVFNE